MRRTYASIGCGGTQLPLFNNDVTDASFAVAPGVDLAPAKAGAKVAFTLEKQHEWSFAIVHLAAL